MGIHFLGSTNAKAREMMQRNFLERIKEETFKEISREALGSMFPLISPTNLTLPFGAKWPRDTEHEFVY